jgi:hypothetical protein
VPASSVPPQAVRPPMKPGPYQEAKLLRYTVTLPRVWIAERASGVAELAATGPTSRTRMR